MGGLDSARRVLFAAAFMMTVVACSTPPEPPDPSPPPPPEEVEMVDVVAVVPVAAGQIVWQRPDGLAGTSAEALVPGLAMRLSIDDHEIRLAWVGATARQGPQVRLFLEFADKPGSVPTVTHRFALEDAAGDDIGGTALEVRSSGSVEPAGGSLDVATFDHASMPGFELRATFADHPLGDVSGDGDLDVRDALQLLQRTEDGLWSPFEAYHSDIDGNDLTDRDDIGVLLDKIVDPDLPARLHVKPRDISFVQLDDATDRDGIVLIANQGRAPLDSVAWTKPDGVEVSQLAGLTDQSYALRLDLPATARPGWTPGFMTIDHRPDGADAEQVAVRVGHLVVLIAGQSNATAIGSPLYGWPETPRDEVRLFGNDYVWKNASEPMDDTTNQVDEVTRDTNTRYSMGTKLGNLLYDATGFVTYLIPSTRNGSELDPDVGGWVEGTPEALRLDRSTLFGSTNYRAQVSAGLQPNLESTQPYGSEAGPVSVLVWYQGESDSASASVRRDFQVRTNAMMDALGQELDVPVVYVQLASHYDAQANVRLHAVAELQRQMETTFGPVSKARAAYHMVPAFDLPRSDQIHLSAYGQRVLAERVDLAIQQHVLGEPVDGTGPRLVELRSSDRWIDLTTTHELAPVSLDEGYFTVYDGEPTGAIDDISSYGDNRLEIVSVVVNPSDPTSVLIELASTPSDTPWVRYMARPNVGPATTEPSAQDTWDVLADGVVIAANGGLPLPVFGPLSAPSTEFTP